MKVPASNASERSYCSQIQAPPMLARELLMRAPLTPPHTMEVGMQITVRKTSSMDKMIEILGLGNIPELVIDQSVLAPANNPGIICYNSIKKSTAKGKYGNHNGI